jgi:hypothetical protein
MARPTLFDRPMTAAERMRLYRARKRGVVVAQSQRTTVRQLAEQDGISERLIYYVRAFARYTLIEWDEDMVRFLGSHGKIGIPFLAEVCRYGDAAAQTAVRDCIKQSGAAAGKALWRQLMPNHPDLERKLKLAEERKRDRQLGRRRRRRRMNPHLGMVF